MKRFSIIMFFAVISIIPVIADNYIIKSMNGKSIQIGNRTCNVNSEFSSDETIHWSTSKVTIIEAQNVKTKTICYFVPTGKQNKDSSRSSNILQRFLNYFTSVNHQSTREAESYSLDEALTINDFPLADTIRIKTNDIDDTKRYYASFYINGEKRTMPLPIENGDIIFERSRFLLDGITLPYKYILTIYYIKGDFYYEITSGMSLTVIKTENQ